MMKPAQRDIEDVRQACEPKLEAFRKIGKTLDEITLPTEEFMAELKRMGLAPNQSDFLKKSVPIADEYTPIQLKEITATLKESQPDLDHNLDIFADFKMFRPLVEAVATEDPSNGFYSGKDQFWRQVQDSSQSIRGTREIPNGWAVAADGFCKDPISTIKSRNLTPQEAKIIEDVEAYTNWHMGWYQRALETWGDPIAHFYFELAQGRAYIASVGKILCQGYQIGRVNRTLWFYSDKEIPSNLKEENRWAQFLLTPYDLLCPIGFHELLKEADKQGVKLFYDANPDPVGPTSL